MQEAHWKIRSANKTDISFIYTTWLKSYYYNSWTKATSKTTFFNNYTQIIDNILLRANIDVACLPDKENIILGYMVSEIGIIHYAFTKENFTKYGIAKSLYLNHFKEDEKIDVTHKTRLVSPIFNKHTNLNFNPFLLYNKGDL